MCTILGKPSQYYGTYECENFNHCSPEQKKICEKFAKQRKNKSRIIRELQELLKQLKINSNDYCYKYDKEKGLELYGISLDVKTLAYLSHILGVKVSSASGHGINDIYNSTLNGSKPLVLRRQQ